jgi:hypothetical protein
MVVDVVEDVAVVSCCMHISHKVHVYCYLILYSVIIRTVMPVSLATAAKHQVVLTFLAKC